MTESALYPTKEPALALVPQPVVSHALAGTMDERMRAFDQIAANIASLQLNGWDSVQKAKAACWLADGKGEHPAVFMENHFVMLVKGRLTVEPKWEYMVRKLKETVPGFRFKVLTETDDCAKVWMSDGADEHTVEYTLEDAKRQGLMGRDNAWSSGSTREMCLKQAIKRCARRIGVGRGVTPWVEVEMAPVAEAEEQPAASGTPPGASATEKKAKSDDPVAALSKRLTAIYGKQTSAVALEKASLLYNAMQVEATGVDPKRVFKSPREIGPVEAHQLLDYLDRREMGPEKAKGSTDATPAAAEPPAMEAPEPEPESGPPPESPQDAYDELVMTVSRARKALKRTFVVESPSGSGTFWFNDKVTINNIGRETTILLMEKQEVVAETAVLVQLEANVRQQADEAERGGR